MSPNALNYALYQTGWLAAVVGAARGYPWVGMGVATVLAGAHIALARQRRSELVLVIVAGATGLVVDSTQVHFGLITFPAGGLVPWLCPPWIVVMWMQFATTFRFSLEWLLGRPVAAAAFGAIGGPLAYMVGDRLGAVVLGEPRTTALLVLSSLWAVAVPALVTFAGRESPAGYRLHSPGRAGA